MTRDPFKAFLHGMLTGSAITAGVIALILSFTGHG